jgi:hypothetical protein
MSLYRVIEYVVRDRPEFGLQPGFCILGVRKPCSHERMDEPVHRLKTWPEFYDDVRDGIKSFELRRDDREPRYAVGQMIELVRFEPCEGIRNGLRCSPCVRSNRKCADAAREK